MITARELGVFTAVGTAATGVHLGVVAGGVPFGVPPLLANVLAFCVSFAVAFIGHARWSFPIERKAFGSALRRFATVSVLTFGLNEACYAGALKWTTLDYRVALFAVIISLAGLKLLASKHWAFALD